MALDSVFALKRDDWASRSCPEGTSDILAIYLDRATAERELSEANAKDACKIVELDLFYPPSNPCMDNEWTGGLDFVFDFCHVTYTADGEVKEACVVGNAIDARVAVLRAKKGKGKLVLRLFDVSGDLTVKRAKKRKFRDVVVPADARSWSVENKATDSTVAVLGFAQGKNFMPLVESVPVQAYSPEGSEVNVDDVFVKASLGGAAMGGFGSSGLSSMSAKNWLENALGSLSSSSGSMFSGALSSAALKSNKLELPKDSVNYGKDFFLWVKTRLIVYGGTRPDAHLQVRGEPFPLNPDGTFSFEEDLPDSTKIIPVFATDKDGDFPTTIVPIVVKRTE